MFLSPSSKGSFSFANVAPRARCAWNFIDDIALVVFGRSKLRDREILTGLLVTWMSCSLRILVRGSVMPLM